MRLQSASRGFNSLLGLDVVLALFDKRAGLLVRLLAHDYARSESGGLVVSGLVAWLASVPDGRSAAWLQAHPVALALAESFGGQGFSECAGLISLMLPAGCVAGGCSCVPSAVVRGSG